MAILSSGGKESSYSLWWAICRGWDVDALLTISINGTDSWMFQRECTQITKLQAISCGINHIEIETSGEREQEVDEVENQLAKIIKNSDLEGVVVGALRSDYQKTRLEMMCERLNVAIYCPIWHHVPKEHMSRLLTEGFEVKIVKVACEGLGEEWLGRNIDDIYLKQLFELSNKYRFNLDGEGGEFETVVLNGPMMKNKIELTTNNIWEGNRGYCEILEAKLIGN